MNNLNNDTCPTCNNKYVTLDHLLLLACERDELAACVTLVDIGANVNMKTKCNTPLLHIAIYNGNIRMVMFLLDKGADVETTDEEGNTALAIAERTGDNAIIQILKILKKEKFTPDAGIKLDHPFPDNPNQGIGHHRTTKND
jgi:ankyrin repeat protein